MVSGARIGAVAIAAALALFSASPGAVQPDRPPSRGLPDVDVRESRPPALPSAAALAEMRRASPDQPSRRTRIHPHTGAIRVLDAPGIAIALDAVSAPAAVAALASRLGLAPADLSALTPVRSYVSASTGVRHLVFAQSADGIPVFDGVVSVHASGDGDVRRVTSSAAPLAGRRRTVTIPAAQAAALAVEDVRPGAVFSAIVVGGAGGATRATVFDRGTFARDITVSLTWFAAEGRVGLAWHVAVEPDSAVESYDILIDAQSGERLLRRNRVRYANGSGRVPQSAAGQAIDPRRPDPMPAGADGCPPITNYELRSLDALFRDPATVLFNTGQLAGNNTRIFRKTDGAASAIGTNDGSGWTFDFPFNSASSAETALFFSLNYAHDFFYDLGFDEAAGNYQVDNFGRGGVGGDSIKGIARANGRNNATFMPAPEGSSPTISMFLFDGRGCWSADTDGDGTQDLDGDYDFDIVIHEFTHGVSLRLNTVFTGSEADAMGEGFSDFFPYSITGDTTLAEYAYPGGIRGVNAKTYADWTCLFGFWCEPHANGEIWVNVLWDVRERFRRDLVRGSESAAITESHQLAVDALKLSPPSPTMLDMRDALLLADSLRNPGPSGSANFCRIWEPFAARGMGLNATDTADNGNNVVRADFSVPAPCEAPPPPPTVTITVPIPTATEAGPVSGRFAISRGTARDVPLVVSYILGGTAGNGVDYNSTPTSATIPAGAADVFIDIVPIDDTLLEANETVWVSLLASSGYTVGSPSSGTVTLVSDDVAPDFVVTVVTVPQTGAAGGTINVTDTTKNQGKGASGASETFFYLSQNLFFDASDVQIGSRSVPELAVGASHTATTSLSLPSPLAPGQYAIYVKADGAGTVVEEQELNNLRYATVMIGPDLTVPAFTGPATGGAGLSMTVSDTTMNSGGAPAEATTTRFYLSTNYLWDAADTPLQGRNVPALAPGASSSASTVVTLPSGTAMGTYYLIARADGPEALPEASETNNYRWISFRVGPDLVVTGLSAPATAGAGLTISVVDTTSNTGGGIAGVSSTRFYLSTNYALDPSDIPLDARAVPELPPAAGHPATTAVTIPSTVAGGTYYLFAKADAGETVVETFETNNARYVLITIGPDLVVSAVSAPPRAAPGGTITVNETTKNTGAGPAAESVTAWYLSTNYLLDAADVRLAPPHAVPALNTGASASSSVQITLPPVAPGLWYLIAAADDGKVVSEMLEGNNTRYTWMHIGPDLYVGSVSVPSTMTAGATVTVSDSTGNHGTPAPASRTRFYLSKNNALDASDVLLGAHRDVPPLAQGATSSGTTLLSIPAGLSGSYYLLVVADAEGAVAEANETNNLAPRAVQIH